jgi:hypothetical protein
MPPGSSREACSVSWARPVGLGSIRRDYGHDLATNAAGDVLLAARLERLDLGAWEQGNAAGELGEHAAPSSGKPVTDVTAGRLVRLAAFGGPVWSLPLCEPGRRGAPRVALDDGGGAYVAGLYAPGEVGLCGGRELAVTKLSAAGAVEWSRPLLPVAFRGSQPHPPAFALAADPGGGACVTWIEPREGRAAVRAVRFTEAGETAWDHAWKVTSWAREPFVGVDAGGGATLSGIFQGEIDFGPGFRVESWVDGRYLVRVPVDGRVRRAHLLRFDSRVPHALAVARDGAVGLLTLAQPRGASAAPPELVVARLDAAAGLHRAVRVPCEPRTLLSSLSLAPAGKDGFAVGGYLSGALRVGASTLRNVPPAVEGVFVGAAGGDRLLGARVFPGTQLQAGLSVHGAADGAVLFGGWICGTVDIGEHKIASPGHSALFFLAKLSPGAALEP